jgi:hypothetical protein
MKMLLELLIESVEKRVKSKAGDNCQVGKRKISASEGEAAISGAIKDEALAVRYLLQLIEDALPGRSVELRVPPYGAIQCIEGLNHRRGTPPNVVEINSEVFLSLAFGKSSWQEEVENGKLVASGELAGELSKVFPLRGD